MQNNEFQCWLPLNKASNWHEHTWQLHPLGIWNFPGQASERCIGEKRGSLSTYLPPIRVKSPKSAGGIETFQLLNGMPASTSISSRSSQTPEEVDWQAQLPSGSQKGIFNTPGTGDAGGEYWATQVGGSMAKGICRWTTLAFYVVMKNCYCTLPFSFFVLF